MEIVEYPFPADPAATLYCVFPAELEGNALVLFHATPAKNVEAIKANGFKPDPNGESGLKSVSFAKRSDAALTHAVAKRREIPGAWCIFAVRYDSLDGPTLKVNVSDVHDYALDPPPEIIGYCIMPESYKHR